MSVKDGKEYLYLIWKCSTTRRQYIIGQLSRNGEYEFQYCGEIKAAMDAGFKPLVVFENLDVMYRCKELFPVFSNYPKLSQLYQTPPPDTLWGRRNSHG